MFPYAASACRGDTFTDPQRWGLCRCPCHEHAYDDDPFSGRPAADEKGLCTPCAEAANQPWTQTLASLT